MIMMMMMMMTHNDDGDDDDDDDDVDNMTHNDDDDVSTMTVFVGCQPAPPLPNPPNISSQHSKKTLRQIKVGP